MPENIQIINPVLTYVQYSFANSTFDGIKRVLIDFYSQEEISSAKQSLWDACTEYLPTFANRQDSNNRSAKEAETLDILNAYKRIDNTEDVTVQCLTNKLDRIPRCEPEELDLLSMMDRIIALENKVQNHEGKISKQNDALTKCAVQVCQNSDSLEKCEETVSKQQASINALYRVQSSGSYAKAASQSNAKQPGTKPKSNDQSVGQHGRISIPQIQVQPPERPERSRSTGDVPGSVTVQQLQAALSDPLVTDNVNLSGGGHTGNDTAPHSPHSQGRGDSFEYPRYMRKQQARKAKQAVYGKGSDSTGSLKSVPRRADLFVFRLDPETEGDDVKGYLQTKDVHVHKVQKMSRDDYMYKSYRICIDFSDMSTVLNEDFWPEGIGCREFTRRRTPGGRLVAGSAGASQASG